MPRYDNYDVAKIISDHLNIQVGGKVNKKKENSTYVGVLSAFFEKRLYYEQIHLYM